MIINFMIVSLFNKHCIDTEFEYLITNNVLPLGRSRKISKTKTEQLVCGSVYIIYIVLYHTVMRIFFNYCGISSSKCRTAVRGTNAV